MRTEALSISFRGYMKAGLIFAATTASYFFAKATGVLPSWFNWEKPEATDLAVSEPTNNVLIESTAHLSTDNIAAENLSLTDFNEVNLTAFKIETEIQQLGQDIIYPGKRMLLQANSVINSIPDQIIDAAQPYIYSLDNIFLENFTLLGAVETGKTSLPKSITLQYGLISKISGSYYNVKVQDNLLFAQGFTNINIFNISDLNNPRLLSQYSFNSVIWDMIVKDILMFVAAGPSGFQIINFSIPANPILTSSLNMGYACSIVLKNETAFVIELNSGSLQLFNVTNTSSPTLLSVYNQRTFGLRTYIYLNHEIVFISSGNRLTILNVSNLTAPHLIKDYITPGNTAMGIAFENDVLFIADGREGVLIINVANLSNPYLVTTYNTPDSALDIVVQSNIAFIADSTSLQVFDISELTTARHLGMYITNSADKVAIQNNVVFIPDEISGMHIVNLTTGQLIGSSLQSNLGIFSITVSAVNINSTIAVDQFYLTIDQFPRQVITTLLDQSITPDIPLTLLLDTDLLFSNPGDSFLKLSASLDSGSALPSWIVLSIEPNLISTYSASGSTSGVTIKDNLAFVVDSLTGLRIVDITNPTTPFLVEFYSISGAQKVDIYENLVIVAVYSSDSLIIDISVPQMPHLLSSYSLIQAVDVRVVNDVAFFVSFAGLSAVNISKPNQPFLISSPYCASISKGANCAYNGFFIKGDLAFLSNASPYFDIINISNPANFSWVSSYLFVFGSLGLTVQDNVAFLVGGVPGLVVIDVTDPVKPSLIGSCHDISSYANTIVVQGNTAFIADKYFGLKIVDVSNLAVPYLIGAYTSHTQAYDLVIKGVIAFVADLSTGLEIIDISQWQLTATPNVTSVGNYNIELVATDILGGSASTQPFSIRVEGPPQFHGDIRSQYAKVGQLFNYFIPQGLITDPNFDPISFNATLQMGGPLPAWLKFNGFSAAFAGIPQGTDTGNLTIVLTATDNIAGSVNTTFGLLVVYTPVLNQPLVNQVVEIDSLYQWAVPQNTFLNPNGDALIYSARWSGQSALPAWLNFNNITRQFYGMPGPSDENHYLLSVNAIDAYGGQASSAFTLVVEYFPRINQSIAAQVAGVGIPFTFSVAPDAFAAENPLALTYSASRTDEALLPNWLSFNPALRTFSGVPQATDTGILSIQLKVIDQDGASTQQSFNLTIKSFPKVVGSIPAQLAGVGLPFSYPISSAIFVNPNQGPLFYAMQKADSSALPDWLNFNNVSLLLSGLANSTAMGRYDLSVLAKDAEGAHIAAPLSLLVEYFPRLNQTLSAPIAQVGQPFIFRVPGNTFIDSEGDALTYQASSRDGGSLPSWLSFSPQTQIFSGVPQVTDLGILPLHLTATDSHGASVGEDFNLTVKYFPKVAHPIPSQVVDVGHFFNIMIANTTCVDLDSSVLLYSAAQSSGSALPGWIHFNNKTLQFSGTAGEAEVGSYALAMICQEADDSQAAQVAADFSLLVEHFPILNRPVTSQIVGVGEPYVLILPANTFMDLDDNSLLYNARLAEGATLPNWLSFNSQTLVFSGVPQSTDLGLSTIQLSAMDSVGGQAEQIFNLTVIYIPQTGAPIAPQLADIGETYQFILPEDAFLNPGGEGLNYSAAQQGDRSLPAWLKFNTSSRQFFGIPRSTDGGDYSFVVTAVDGRGLSASTQLSLLVENFPRLHQPIFPFLAGINLPFTFNLPYNTFADLDGDVLSYQAMRADGSVLPNWLSFNRQSLTFSGVPLETDHGVLTLQLRATDSAGGYGKTNFTIDIVHYPAVVASIPTPPIARENRFFSFSIPIDTFSDPDEPQLLYNATQTNGQPLPSWLHFDAQALIFSGIPSSQDVGALDTIVIGKDSRHLQAQAPLQFVISTNTPPLVKELISDQSATVGELFNFYVPNNVIIDADGDNLTYTAVQTGGLSLPEWLYFDAQTLNFRGTPGRGDTNTYAVRALGITLSARDDSNQASTPFTINVGGASYLALAINIGLPLLSGLVSLFEAYRQRALCLNRCHKQRYQKLQQTADIGGGFSYPLATPPERVHHVKAQLPQPRQGCCRFFKADRRHLSGEAHLPAWLEYDTNRNVLYTPGIIPVTAPRELIIQVKDHSNILQEEFRLMIAPAAHPSQSEQFDDPVMPYLEEGGDETGIELRSMTFGS